MKNILSGAVAAIALVAISAPAAAQTNELHYAGTALGGYTITNPQDFPFPFDGLFILAGELGVATQVGTRYTAQASAPGDTETATPTVTVDFRLSGTVNKDCSFYSGNTASATNIDFGVIGIRTGNNENVNNAFEMVGPAVANIESLTAGCNFNNEVEISKDDIRGLVNNAPGGFDTNEFTANIPYEVDANWTGVALNAQTTGSAQNLNVATNANAGTKQQGAWRSAMTIDITAPVITGKGLVAGTYEGTTTLTLRAL
ncbi:hypothetical protein AB1K62_07625 [Parasphingorhabdus sp. JC815]|uniref:hypothetical protein n=1 Tax=Parasphingorhabdus sp. JC815 TaxID=3232140 RepID=UPI003459EF39